MKLLKLLKFVRSRFFRLEIPQPTTPSRLLKKPPSTAQFTTTGELAQYRDLERIDMAQKVAAFAFDQMPFCIDDSDLTPNTDAVDFDDPKTSLFAHPGVQKIIRLVASNSAIEQWFQLENFTRLHTEKYVADIREEIKRCTDPVIANELDDEIRFIKQHVARTPDIQARVLEHAQIYCDNVQYCIHALIKFCKQTIEEWIEFIPSKKVLGLLAEIKELDAKNLSSQLRFFGLNDFVTLMADKQ